MRSSNSLLAVVLAFASFAGAGETLWAASPPGVQWVADVTPDRSTSYIVNSAHRLADGTVLVLESMFLQGITASHLDATGAALATSELPLPNVYGGNWTFAVDSAGAVFIGLTAAPRPFEAWVMKFDGLTGRALWPGPFHYRPGPQTDTLIRSIALDQHGNLFVSGLSSSQTSVTFLFSLDGATGGILWGPISFADPSTPGATFSHVDVDANGDAVVSGSWGDDAGTKGQLEAFKFNGRTGAILWGPVLVPAGATGPDVERDSELDPDGNLVVVGQRTDGTFYRPIVVKIAGSDGSILWGPLIPNGTGTNYAAVSLLRIDSRGDVLLGVLLPGGQVPTLLKIAGREGAGVWGPIPYPGDASAFPLLVAGLVVPGGDLVVTFSERKSNPVMRSALTTRIDGATGAALWAPAVLPSAGARGALLLEPNGNVLLATSRESTGFTFTAEVVFYSGATGATIGGPLDLPPGARSGQATRVAVDANGDVVTLGQLSKDGFSYQTVIVKYRGTTGAVLWGPVEVPSATWGSPRDLKIAANGDPIWIGTGESAAFGTGGIVLSRFNGSTGAVVWGPRVFTRDYAVSLALDGNGDIFAAGNAVILKCDGVTGALLWGPFVVPTSSVSALRVGPGGDVTVAGTYALLSSVVQYRGSTGALAWGPVPIAAGSFPQAMGVDASGDILLAGSGLVMKLRGVDGSAVWGPIILVDASGGSSSGAALALDPAGNPVAEVFTYDGVTSRRAATFAKYDNASGTRLWGPVTWDAGEGPEPEDVFLSVDPSGDVVIAANGRNDVYPDMAVRKYSGANGSSIWGPVTFDGPGTNYLLTMALLGKDPILAGSSMGSMRTVRFGFGLSLETQPWQIPPALCGRPYRFPLQARNGASPYTFAIAGGSLPAGLVLDPATGVLSGITGRVGTFLFRVRVGAGAAIVERDFTMVVVDGQPVIDILTTAATLCAGQSAVLSVPGMYSNYRWLPGGETTQTLTVSPATSTVYGFIGTTSSGCEQRGTVSLTVLSAPTAPAISGPSTAPALATGLVANVADHAGSRYDWSIVGGEILSGQGSHEILFTAGVGGDLVITVVEVGTKGCRAPATTFVVVVAPASTRFFPVFPCRAYDSRISGPPLAAGERRRIVLAGLCGLPSTARAIAMNVTAVALSGGGSVSVTPGGSGGVGAGPSWITGQIRASSSIVGFAEGGGVDVSCQMTAGAVHLVIDVAGYFE